MSKITVTTTSSNLQWESWQSQWQSPLVAAASEGWWTGIGEIMIILVVLGVCAVVVKCYCSMCNHNDCIVYWLIIERWFQRWILHCDAKSHDQVDDRQDNRHLIDHHDGLLGDLCEAGWDATEQEHEFDQLTEDDLRFHFIIWPSDNSVTILLNHCLINFWPTDRGWS